MTKSEIRQLRRERLLNRKFYFLYYTYFWLLCNGVCTSSRTSLPFSSHFYMTFPYYRDDSNIFNSVRSNNNIWIQNDEYIIIQHIYIKELSFLPLFPSPTISYFPLFSLQHLSPQYLIFWFKWRFKIVVVPNKSMIMHFYLLFKISKHKPNTFSTLKHSIILLLLTLLVMHFSLFVFEQSLINWSPHNFALNNPVQNN